MHAYVRATFLNTMHLVQAADKARVLVVI